MYLVLNPVGLKRTARLHWHSEEWKRSYAFSTGPKEWLHGVEILFRFCVVETYLQVMLASRHLDEEARAWCLGMEDLREDS
ncbi:hypothetical protein TIFTF001_053626 [Ficus carica]|uniref:Uncharacterized protein n=1 Tax=Ficus carica TaxID=3494 RepID=A0AA88EGV7_FICCA|nr:hypothetical protein TIFTF001_053626 [Ficus carica]